MAHRRRLRSAGSCRTFRVSETDSATNRESITILHHIQHVAHPDCSQQRSSLKSATVKQSQPKPTVAALTVTGVPRNVAPHSVCHLRVEVPRGREASHEVSQDAWPQRYSYRWHSWKTATQMTARSRGSPMFVRWVPSSFSAAKVIPACQQRYRPP